jgi:molybdopterin molybdotransferase
MENNTSLIPFEEALQMMLSSAKTLSTEKLPFMECIGRILAEDIFSDVNMPPFDKAAMDGYACKAADLKNELTVIEIIAAGAVPQKEVHKNECSKIMTGAMMPQGADTILIVEECVEIESGKIKFQKVNSKSNVCYLAEDVKIGDRVVQKNILISSQHIPTFASVGKTILEVYKMPKVAIISTGDELVEPNEKPQASQIRNSNAYSMLAQLKTIGVEAEYLGVAKDTKEAMQSKLKEAMQIADIVIFSGAVSMGDFDFVPIVLKEEGIDVLFHGVAAKPGKKTVFGTKGNQWFLGVPGNPVSSFVQIQFLLLPFIFKLMNTEDESLKLKLPLTFDYTRKRAGRKEFIPIRISKNGEIEKLNYHGSAHINAIGYANAFLIIDLGVLEIKRGELVDVRPI